MWHFLNPPTEDTAQETVNGMMCVTSEHTWAHQLHRRAHGRDAEPRAVQLFSNRWVWWWKMPNALSEPAELRGHLITARCGEGAPRTSPSPRRKHPAGSPSTPRTGKQHEPGGEDPQTPCGAPQSGKRTGRNEDASTLLGMFFQLKSWELESVNNDLGLQTTLQRDTMGRGILARSKTPNL